MPEKQEPRSRGLAWCPAGTDNALVPGIVVSAKQQYHENETGATLIGPWRQAFHQDRAQIIGRMMPKKHTRPPSQSRAQLGAKYIIC